MAVARPRVGLLGGSFDPVHKAHILLAETAWRELDLDEVQLIPTGNPWQRAPLQAQAHHRLAMLEHASRQHDWLTINTVEIDRNGPTYTIDTVSQLPDGIDYYWILGSDQLNNFCSWRAWRDIARYVHLAVAGRPGSPDTTPKALGEHLDTLNRTIIRLPFEPQAVSATQIRTLIAQGESADPYLHPAVAAYIQQHQLYRGDATHQLTV